ncbi:hypothetical protein B296_00053579 [Ensete ventricosum]|uniref:Uncharacterized protein n=1 Tax=Ensete ventricosum TaxID=4639 RepID=A0A426XK91_ENSVE|nr:hypothetical protein B296_00053579 [Ensete ventricosum]
MQSRPPTAKPAARGSRLRPRPKPPCRGSQPARGSRQQAWLPVGMAGACRGDTYGRTGATDYSQGPLARGQPAATRPPARGGYPQWQQPHGHERL